jgi:GTP cyclohydrolase I
MMHDRAAAERAIADLIRALGLDPAAEPELAQTPSRVADFFIEACSGLEPDAAVDLAVFPHTGGPSDLVVVRDLEFHSLCVHHLAPFFGVAHVAYVPARHLIGISGPARLVELYARRLQLQERMAHQIADHLTRLVEPQGVAVTLVARHLCMEMRGIRKRGDVVTRVRTGVLAEAHWSSQLP